MMHGDPLEDEDDDKFDRSLHIGRDRVTDDVDDGVHHTARKPSLRRSPGLAEDGFSLDGLFDNLDNLDFDDE